MLRRDFRMALAGGIIGALVVGMLTPVGAAVGDVMKVGQVNTGNAATTIKGSSQATLRLVQNNASGRPIQLKGPGKRRWVRYLNADRVDGFHAKSLVRVAHAETTNVNETAVFGGGTAGDLLSTQITAPTRGLLFIVGSADSSLNTSSAMGDSYGCTLRVNNTAVDGSYRVVRVSAVTGATHTSNNEEDCSTNGVKEVTAGTWTIDLRVDNRNTSTPQAMFAAASLQVLFVPFGADGTQPAIP